MSVNYSNSPSPDFTIVLFYRPPNSGHAPLDSLFNILLLCSCNLYLVGDFNVDFLSKVSPLYHKLISTVSSFNLTQVVSEPTRITPCTTTLIDLIFVSSTNSVSSCKTIRQTLTTVRGLQLIFLPHQLESWQNLFPGKFGGILSLTGKRQPNY